MEKKRNLWVIPTDKPSPNILLKKDDGTFQIFDNTFYNIWKMHQEFGDFTPSNATYQNIYITDDSEIKESGWYEHNGVIFRADDVFDDGNNPNNSNPKVTDFNHKIILTTDLELQKDGIQAIDDEFLKWFVKNPSCEEIKIANSLVRVSSFDWRTDYKIIIPSSEIWKDVPEFEGYYQVSNLGNVKSLSRTILGRGKHNTLLKERILKFSTSTNGYYQVILQKEGFKKIYKVHSLVAICFLNHTPDGTHNVVIDHINEVKTDNRLENLRLIGHRENVSRSMKNNTSTYVGVSWSKNAKKWISQITIEGKTKYLGLFDNEEDANKKYLETLKDL